MTLPRPDYLRHSYTIIIVTNQALRGKNAIVQWKPKIPAIAASVGLVTCTRVLPHFSGKQLPDVPFHIYAATAKDGFRKPIPGMWYEIEKEFANDNVQIGPCLSPPLHHTVEAAAHQYVDLSHSFFIGDAAGRKSDHAGTDRKWALNVGIPFQTPEVDSLLICVFCLTNIGTFSGILSQASTGTIPTRRLQRIFPSEP